MRRLSGVRGTESELTPPPLLQATSSSGGSSSGQQQRRQQQRRQQQRRQQQRRQQQLRRADMEAVAQQQQQQQQRPQEPEVQQLPQEGDGGGAATTTWTPSRTSAARKQPSQRREGDSGGGGGGTSRGGNNVVAAVRINSSSNHCGGGGKSAVNAEELCESDRVMAAAAAANGTNKNNGHDLSNDDDGGAKESPLSNGGGGGGRRERKQKFDVRKLLNIRGSTNVVGKQQQPDKAATPSDSSLNDDDDCDDSNNKTRRSGRVKAAAAAAAAAAASLFDSPVIPTTNGVSECSDAVLPAVVAKVKCKEPLLKEAAAENPSAVVLGKRERKRKKFWDEQEVSNPTTPTPPPPPSKVMKKTDRKSTPTPQQQQQTKLPAGTKRERKASVDGKHSSSKGAAVTQPQNGKTLAYLLFDLSLEPETIAGQMVEGVNIPGPGVPIPIDSSNLPSGWEKRVIQRGIGITKGKWDVFILSPSGKSFRSKIELQRHFDEKKLPYKSEAFDFALDDHMKRLRQIWKQHIARDSLGRGRHRSSGGAGEEVFEVESCSSPGPDVGVESETGQGIRCSIDKCGKLFRNDRLLQMHVKHYHPQVAIPVKTESKTGEESAIPQLPPHQSDVPADRTAPTSLSTVPAVTTAKRAEKRKHSAEKLGEKRQKTASISESELKYSRKVQSATPRSSLGSGKKSSSVETAAGGRSRNDSILSVGSDIALRGEVDDALYPLSAAASGTCPPTPPTFRISKRRQAQLKKKSPVLRRVEDSAADGNCYLDEFMTFLCSAARGQATAAAEDVSAPSSYPPSEMGASVASEHLTSEEVVNCTCRRTEEDGLMIQCDICLCWQHGLCLGLDEEDQVPDKYVCQICRDPPGGRTSCLYGLDQDWLKEGKFVPVPLPNANSPKRPHTEREAAFKKLSELMADLSNLSKVLHSLRVKLHVASQPNNSKVFMWSSPWEKEVLDNIFQGQNEEVPLEMHVATRDMNFAESSAEHASSLEAQNFPHVEFAVDNPFIGSSSKHSSESVMNGDDGGASPGEGSLVDRLEKGAQQQQQQQFRSSARKSVFQNGSDHDAGPNGVDGEDHTEELDISMIPSVSEVERLLPSIIKASLEEEQLSNDALQPSRVASNPVVIIPEQKRIDKEECRANLLDHIEKMQLEVDHILDKVEANLAILETEGELLNSPDRLVSKTKAIAIMLSQDLHITRKMIGAV